MPAATSAERITKLERKVMALARRLKGLEEQRYRELTSAIGFEVTTEEVEDEEFPEFEATLRR